MITEIQLRELGPAAKRVVKNPSFPKHAPKVTSPQPATAADAKPMDSQVQPQEVGTNEEESGAAQTAAQLSAQDRYKLQLARLLNQRKSYPKIARQLKQQGRVMVQFLVNRDGRILEAKVVSPSPFEALNRSAEDLVKSLNGLEPFPEEIQKSTWLFTVPIDYQM